MNQHQLRDELARALPHLADRLLSVARPAILVEADPRARPRGTRFGGLPRLPAKTRWPTSAGIPLEFVGQLDLVDLAGFEAAAALPTRGTLSFFFDGMLTGYDQGQPTDRCRVHFTPAEPEALCTARPPVKAPPKFTLHPEVGARFSATWTLPELEEIDGDEFPTIPPVEPILTTRKDREAYRTLRRTLRGPTIGTHLLGHADGVQGGEVLFTAVTRADGGRRFRYEDYAWTQPKALTRKLRELVLLFQAASGAGGVWGGTGVLYFLIRRGDLAAQRFERTFALLQTT